MVQITCKIYVLYINIYIVHILCIMHTFIFANIQNPQIFCTYINALPSMKRIWNSLEKCTLHDRTHSGRNE